MFTKNFYKLLHGHMYSGVNDVGTIFSGTEQTMSLNNTQIRLNGDGTITGCTRLDTMVTNQMLTGSASSTNAKPYIGVILGNGNILPNINDYSLSGTQITNFAYNVALSLENMEDGGRRIVGVYTITNNNSESITISEIGLTALMYKGSGSTYWPVLIERTVLDTPVTIEPQAVGQVKYIIEMKLPVA